MHIKAKGTQPSYPTLQNLQIQYNFNQDLRRPVFWQET